MELPLASQLEERRVELGWTQGYLGILAGYHENTVRRVLRGEPVNHQTVVDVAQALGFRVVLMTYQKSA